MTNPNASWSALAALRVPLLLGAYLSASLLLGCTRDEGPEGRAAGASAGSTGSAGGSGSACAGSQGLGAATSAPGLQLTTSLVRRLSLDELAYTLGDVLGTAPTAEQLAPIPRDRPLEGFVNIATSQTVSTDHVMGYAKLARASAAGLDAELIGSHAACDTSSAACWTSFVQSVGKLLFRRPLEARESELFAQLLQSALSEGTSFVEGARVVVEAMLQAPQFLYRLEHETAAAAGLSPSAERTLGGYEMASRLSYLLWSSAPDAALVQAAEAGELDNETGLQAELARMLGDSARAQRPTLRFLTDWAKLESLPKSELLDALVGSLQVFYADALWTKQTPLLDLLTVRRAFLSPILAERYGVVPTGDGIREYDTSALAGRVGLLTQPGLIAGMTNADGGAIVARGLFLQSQLLCGDTPSPPPGFADAIAAFAASQPPTASLRSIADQRAARPECGACHQTFDPLAYGLEQFDYQGEFREVDKFGNTLSTDGWIPGRFTEAGENLPYSGVEAYMTELAKLPIVGSCLAKQHLQFALGRKLGHEDDAVAAELFRSFSQQGGTYPAMLSVIVQHPYFRKMRVE